MDLKIQRGPKEGSSSEGIYLIVFDWLRREEPHPGIGSLVGVTIRLCRKPVTYGCCPP